MTTPTTTDQPADAGPDLLDAVVEALPLAVVAVADDGRIAAVNGRAESLFGYRRDDLLGSSVELLVPFGRLIGRDEVLSEYIHDRHALVTECVARRNDGAQIWVEVTLNTLALERGDGSLLTVRPAGEHQLISERLAILEAFVETSEDAVFSQDADGRVTGWNRSAERIFGYPKDEIIGQPTIMLFPEHLKSETQRVFDTVNAGDRVDRYESEIRRKDGMPIPISLSLCPLFHTSGRLMAAVLIARDVTEQRLAQATLAEIETRIREGEALAHVGSWLWDVRTGTVQWTDELHRIHGVDPLDFEGTLDAHLERIHPEDQARVWRGLTAAVASGRSFEDEYRIVRSSGELRWVFARAEPTVGSAGDVVGLRGISQDVTERRRAQR
jgi:PAS domain S-box-containing protein